MDGWQRMCIRSKEGPASERTPPRIARRSLLKDDSWHRDEHRPSTAGVQGRHRPFLGACRLLDDEGKEIWQQQERVVKGSLPARTWIESQKTASRWEMNSSDGDRVGGLLKERLLQSESTTPRATPTSSAASISSFASTMADLALVGHGRLSRGHDGANGAEQQVSQSDGQASSLKRNHVATEHFDMSVDDWLEVEEELFPADCPTIDCS